MTSTFFALSKSAMASPTAREASRLESQATMIRSPILG